MLEKISGVPPLSEVAAPVQQSEQAESVPDVGTATPHAKRTRISKIKPESDTNAVAGKDPVNADQSNLPAVAVAGSGGDTPAQQPAVDATAPATTTGENKDPVVAKENENKAAVADPKRKHKRPRPLPPIEHKRIVHYYRQAKPIKKKDRRSGDKDRRDGGGSQNRDGEYDKKYKYDDDYSNDDDDDDEELLSDTDWNVDSGDDSDPSDGDESDNDEPDKKRESGQDK